MQTGWKVRFILPVMEGFAQSSFPQLENKPRITKHLEDNLEIPPASTVKKYPQNLWLEQWKSEPPIEEIR
jgi:hypothetical protein